MLPLTVALAKIGIVTAIGWWIDLALDDYQTKRVRRRLDDWWIAFDKITWFNFGQQEGLAALRLFDRVFGPTLFSPRRWISIGIVLAIIALPVLVLIRDRLAVVGRAPDRETMVLWVFGVTWAQIFGMALSLGITRWLTIRVLQLTGFRSILGYVGLFLLSVTLLAVWAPVAHWFKTRLPIVTTESLEAWTSSFNLLLDTLRTDFPFGVLWIVRLAKLVFGQIVVTDDQARTMHAIMFINYAADYLVSVVRIAFSVFFLSCLLLRRFVHQPLSRLGFIWLTSGKPIFAALFGTIAAIIVTLHELL